MWDPGAAYPVIGTILVAIISSITAVYVARRNAKKDVEASIGEAMNDFIDQLQEERKQQRDLLAEERKEHAETRRAVAAMRAYIANIERTAARQGLILPPHDFF